MGHRLTEIIETLPPELQQEIEDFVTFVAVRRRLHTRGAPSGWRKAAGAWRDDRTTEQIIRDLYESRRTGREVEL